MFRRFRAALLISLMSLFLFPPMPSHGAATSTIGGIEWPQNYKNVAIPPALSATTINANNSIELAYTFRVSKTGSIHKIGELFGTVNTTNTVTLGLYTVSTTSTVPTGTLYGGSSVATHIMSTTTDVNSLVYWTLPVDASATMGDIISVVVISTAGATPQLTIQSVNNASNGHFPYIQSSSNSGQSWSAVARVPILFVQYSDGSFDYNPGLIPWTSLTAQTFSNSNTQEYAMGFYTPFPAQVKGYSALTTQSNNYSMYLYQVGGSTTVLVSVSSQNYTGGAGGYTVYTTTNNVTLVANTTYYLSMAPTSTETTTIYTVAFSTDNTTTAMNQIDGGSSVWLASRTASGVWSDMFNKRPMFSVILGSFDNGSGGSGSQKVWGGWGG